jgi:aerobic carbon-monoxide dehydrogenase small subunit
VTLPLTVTVNGRRIEARVEPRLHLADFLRDHLRLSGTHLGCEQGVCGACTVLIDGAPARACLIMAVACDGLEVRTIEGFDTDATMAALRDAFSREHGLQCGFCTPGMLVTARDIVERLPQADEARMRKELAGNLCRCTGYAGIVKAVKAVLEERATAVPKANAATAPEFATDAGLAVRASASKESVAGEARFVAKGAAFAGTLRPTAPTTKFSPAAGEPRPGWTRFEEHFLVHEPPASVWAGLSDVARVATCVPGAELSESDGRTVQGRLKVKLGPMSAAFVGSAVIERDDAALAGKITGAGSDTGSSSRTTGEVSYRLEPADGGRTTRVMVIADYRLQGPLAQFSRSGLMQELGRGMVSEFADNLERSLKGGPSRRPAPLHAGSLLWAATRAWISAALARFRARRP